MTLRILDGDLHQVPLQTRMPFKYGIATMTQAPYLFVRLHITINDQRATGIAADLLPPKWFTKDPTRALADEIQEMQQVIGQAVRFALGLEGTSVFTLWQQVYEKQRAWGRSVGLPPLLTQFGTALVERALIDAFCRGTGQTFVSAVRQNTLGIDLGAIHAELAGQVPSLLLPEQPLTTINARHTIGLADPLTETDIPEGERLHDGLPQALEQCIRKYGLRHFKIKVSGQLDTDRPRLTRIADLLERLAERDFVFTLDGNEAFTSIAAFRTFWEALREEPLLNRNAGRLLFVEQPFHRSVALDPVVLGELAAWQDRPPLIIDESDADLDSMARALDLGYNGTSHKNCKGVFKSIANACLLAQRRRLHPGQPLLMSGEDLVNVGPVALLQDLTVCASLGLASVERNGHHYVAGLSAFPRSVQTEMLRDHGDLYQRGAQGWPTLTINHGTLAVGSLLRAPFGVAPLIDVTPFASLSL